tara:strand:+ start:967 stop:1104 length:138 start_codon:yes stop_codon:yes gene_type:complete
VEVKMNDLVLMYKAYKNLKVENEILDNKERCCSGHIDDCKCGGLK